MIEKVYKQFSELTESRKEEFSELVEIQCQIAKLDAELYGLQLEKKEIAQKLIVYLQKSNYDGIKKEKIIAYLQTFSRGTPSFWEVYKKVEKELCNRDKVKLVSSYSDLSETREKTTSLVVKGV
jgi:septal ring factor EnvC (AmiA/AmiB activator)